MPNPRYDLEAWRLWVGLSPHLDSVIVASQEVQIEGKLLATINRQYGAWHYFQTRFDLAEPLMRRALAIDEKSDGPEHPEVATDLQ